MNGFFKTVFEIWTRHNWTKIWDPRPLQLAIYTVFDEESESEVKTAKIQASEGGKIKKKQTPNNYQLYHL